MLGEKAKLEALIAGGIDVKGDKGGLVIYDAAAMGRYELIEVLIANGASVNTKGPPNGETPLHRAVSYRGSAPSRGDQNLPPMESLLAQNKKRFATLLIAHGADVNAKSNGGITPLHNAASAELVELLLEHGAKIEAQINGNGGTPLYGQRITEVVKALIAHGANIHAKNGSGETALHHAVDQNNRELAKLLIASGANVDAYYPDQASLLEHAIKNNNSEMAALLLAGNAKFNARPSLGISELHWAVIHGDKGLVTQLLLKGAPVNARNRDDETPLDFALQKNYHDIAKQLIDKGAEVNTKNRAGVPMVQRARDLAMLQLLLKNGADVTVKNKDGNALLGTAVDNLALTVFLLSTGANVDIKNERGNTALHLAVGKGQYDVVKVLLAHKANPNAKNDVGQTPLFNAVRLQALLNDPNLRTLVINENRPGMRAMGVSGTTDLLTRPDKATNSEPLPGTKIIKLLVANRADANAKDNRGETPLHIAPTQEIAALFLALGVPVDVRRNDGATALHLAAVYGREELVDLLLVKGANVNALTAENITPLHYAKGVKIVSRLLQSGAKLDAADAGGNTPLFMSDEPFVSEMFLARGATMNVLNGKGQTPLLRMIRTYIASLPAHGLMAGPLGDPLVVAHGGNLDVIKLLISRGADLNLGDEEIDPPAQNTRFFAEPAKDRKDKKLKTALYYVRAAKANREYSELVKELTSLESLLIANGAK